ncbi:Maf family protein [Parasphaerochaeta coccoides]|uniref:Nucleoside triphosphate pyrophosphatase n=1 Tax=Parasphaerochaeta coccoides (strain ATCC BAA-1237 / DSM 17374 / SPN1) TaxID=760011 RepID=F4GLE5_PARC1|nr:Maf family protein [Parasphaerochaeta coccoides]AEC01915.1 Septum formation protein Maf [Parasphaerochaeta coccoides DSM 17374]
MSHDDNDVFWTPPSTPTPHQVRLGTLMSTVILASGSPARKKLLEDCGIIVTAIPTDCDESHGDIAPQDIVHLLARRKMEAYLAMNPYPLVPVITCDTLVHLGHEIFGKAADYEEAFTYLGKMQGRSHQVSTGWALYLPLAEPIGTSHPSSLPFFSGIDTADVAFRPLDSRQIHEYLATGEWQGAAGAYRIQGAGARLVREISGDWTTIAGLPISRISDMMADTVST